MVALIYSAYIGNNLRMRRRVYYRLYRSMVSVFNRSSSDPLQLKKEMDALSSSIINYFIEDKITDEQFDKLMARRDYLMGQTGKNPSTSTLN